MGEEDKEIFHAKETSQGLPIVSKGTIEAIESQFTTGGEGHKWGAQLEKVKERLIKENSHLVEFIEKQVSKYPPQFHNPMFETIVGTIAVLEHQASANKTASIFTETEPPKKTDK